MLDRLRSCAYGNSRFRASRKRFPKAGVKPLVLVEAELRGKTGEGHRSGAFAYILVPAAAYQSFGRGILEMHQPHRIDQALFTALLAHG